MRSVARGPADLDLELGGTVVVNECRHDLAAVTEECNTLGEPSVKHPHSLPDVSVGLDPLGF